MRPRASRPFAPPSTSQAKKKLTLIEPASLKIRLRKQPASQQQPSASSFSGGNDNNGAAAAPAAAAAAHSSYFPSSSAAAPELEVSVSDPVKHGEGVSAYVSYKVQARPISSTTTGGTAGTGTTATTTPASRALAAAPGAVVIRRFRDFQWLRCRLSSTLRGAVVPPLPETSILQKYALSADFIEGRRAALARFANAAAAHPEVRWSEDFAGFLTEAEDDWALRVARVAAADAEAAARAQALGLGGVVGNLLPGCEADFVVLNPRATPLLARKTALANSVDELLFGMVVLGDDRLIERTVLAQAPNLQ